MWKKNFKNCPCARGINFISRSTNSRTLIFFHNILSEWRRGGQGSIRVHKQPSIPQAPSLPLFRRGRSPRNVTVHRANLLCKLADVFSIPQRKHRPGTVGKKMHPTETAEQNVRRAKNNYVIAGEIHRRKKTSRKVRAVMSVGRIFIWDLPWNLFWKSIIVTNAARYQNFLSWYNYLMFSTLNKFLLSM